MVGWTDLPADLSDANRIANVAGFLPDAPVISSDLSRAVDTATAIQGDRKRLHHVRELREINFGAWENRTFAEVEAEDETLIRAYWEQPGDHAPPGGESWNAVEARVNSFVDSFDTEQGDVIAVAHMGVILTQVRRGLGISAYEAFSHKIDNFSVTCIERRNGNWHAPLINHHP